MDREVQKRIGWSIVALIIIWTGLRNLITGRIYGKVITGSARPIEGWFVHILGLALVLAGVWLLVRLINGRNTGQGRGAGMQVGEKGG